MLPRIAMQTQSHDADIARSVLKDRVGLAYRNVRLTQPGSIAALILVVVALWGAVPARTLLVWVAVDVVAIGLRAAGCAAYARYGTRGVLGPVFWRNVFVAYVATFGIIWAVPAVYFFPHASPSAQLVVSLVVAALSAGAAVSYGMFRFAPAVFIGPALVPLAVQFARYGGEHGLLIALTLLVFVVLVSSIAEHVRRTLLQTMALNRRNERLLEDLRVSEEKFRGLVENATDAIVLVQNDRLVYANKATVDLFGYSQEELLRSPITAFMSETKAGRERMYAIHKQRLAGEDAPKQYEAQLKHKNGETRDVLVSSDVVHFPDGLGVISMIKDITELRRVERIRSDFLSMTTHEIRTPVTVIQSSLEALEPELESVLSAEALEIYRSAQRNAQHLSGLVRDLKELDSLEPVRLGYRMGSYAVSTLVAHAVALNQPYGAARNVELRAAPVDDELRIWCDFNRITQVLTNLLTNAAKYGAPIEPVLIDTAYVDGWVRIAVTNRGPGIPTEHHDRVFMPFAQAHDGGVEDGSGLGLSICKSIVEDHEGIIGFESVPGETTTFYFLLREYRPPNDA